MTITQDHEACLRERDTDWQQRHGETVFDHTGADGKALLKRIADERLARGAMKDAERMESR